MRLRVGWSLAAGLLAVSVSVAGSPLRVASDGRAALQLLVAADATPAESTAAQELADYLGQATGAVFVTRIEGEREPDLPAIHVGPTARVRELAVDLDSLGGEAWRIDPDGDDLLLYGGRPRGTLYAVYQFLEQRVGVRWWSPFAEDVPRNPKLTVTRQAAAGEPTWGYRDIFGIEGPREFCARNRINGHYTRLSEAYGGTERYGLPKHVHDFFVYVPPEEYFGSHPEFFSERAGLRYGGESQLCLTNEALLDLVTDKMRGYIDRSRDEARAAGIAPPRLFDFSQNDWGRSCQCDDCRELARREGSESAPLVRFVDRLAERIAASHPGVLVDTLAYNYTVEPPRELRFRENVVLRFAALYQRNFTRPVTAEENRSILEALEGWSERVHHLRVWDYAVTYGPDGHFPLPNLRVLAEDYRRYAELGVEGIFLQHDDPVYSDLADLKLWVLARLLGNPRADYDGLLREFTDGFYGPAGREIRRYLRLLEQAAAATPSRVGFASGLADYGYLTEELLRKAARRMDAAERRVARRPELLERVRHARLALDRAEILLRETLDPAERRVRIERFQATARAQIELRIPPARRAEAIEMLEADIRAMDQEL